MQSPNRVAWAEMFAFTEEQRGTLQGIIGRKDSEKVATFLKYVEIHVSHFLMHWKVAGATPPEQSAQSVALLKKIAKHAKALHAALGELDLTGSDVALGIALSRLGRGEETIEYLNMDLPLLFICAEGAVSLIKHPKRGRPADSIEKQFIAQCGRSYVTCFGTIPTYSRHSMFPKFISQVFSIALPNSPHSGEDNSKIVRSALKSAKILPQIKTMP